MKKILLALCLSVASWGNPQFSGTAFTATVATDGTKQTLINNIETALKNGSSGWTTISGSGTTNLLMQSGTTAQSLQIRARFKDNGSTCIQVYMENVAGTLKPASYADSNGASLLATNGLTYNVSASTFQFLIYTANAATARQFVWVGMPYLNTALASNITVAGFLFSSARSDGDGTSRSNLRNAPVLAHTEFGGAPNYELMVNTSWWESANSSKPTNSNAGAPRLLLGGLNTDWNMTVSTATGYRWRTATPSIVTGDVLIAWGLTVETDEALVNGQLFDCVFIQDSQPINTTSTFDSHNWRNVTNSNVGSSTYYPRGGLWFAIN